MNRLISFSADSHVIGDFFQRLRQNRIPLIVRIGQPNSQTVSSRQLAYNWANVRQSPRVERTMRTLTVRDRDLTIIATMTPGPLTVLK